MLITNENPNTKDENTRKFFDPKHLNADDWLKDNLDETLAKIDQTRIIRLFKGKDKSRKAEGIELKITLIKKSIC